MTSAELEEIKRHMTVVIDGIRSEIRSALAALGMNTQSRESVETLDAGETSETTTRPLVPRSDN